MAQVFLLFGGNLDDPAKTIAEAMIRVEQKIGALVKKSSLYESEPWGFEHENNFLNQVGVYQTKNKPHEILKSVLDIESRMGRTRNRQHYEARNIDIDILFYDQYIVHTTDLTIPHPHIQERRFALEPLTEIASDFMHPVLHETMLELLDKCKDKLIVSRLN